MGDMHRGFLRRLRALQLLFALLAFRLPGSFALCATLRALLRLFGFADRLRWVKVGGRMLLQKVGERV